MDQFLDSWNSYQFRYCSVNNSGLFFLTIALLSGSLSSTAYDATRYMEDCDVVVSASENDQTVFQNLDTLEDNDPAFTNWDSSVRLSPSYRRNEAFFLKLLRLP